MTFFFAAQLGALALDAPPAASPSAPFGLHAGTTVDRLDVVRREDDRLYQVRVPNPSPDFTTYVAIVSPAGDVCGLTATSGPLLDDSFGTKVAARFRALKGSLDGVYGKSRLFDFLRGGAPSARPGDWAEMVRLGHRSMAAFWDMEEQSSLPPDILSVRLEVGAVTWRSTHISLTVEYAGVRSCPGSLSDASIGA